MQYLPLKFILIPGVIITFFISSCNTSRPGLFARKTPHEQYGQRLADAGLRETALGRLWFQAAEQGLASALNISLPYQEAGYFAAERPRASGLKFSGKRGEKLRVELGKKPESGFSIYMDLWQEAEAPTSTAKLLAAADTVTGTLEYEIKNEGTLILRVQPELLKSGAYTLVITTGPSLAFPVSSRVNSNIGSFWGAGRDRGARKHEGIDIFAPFRSPAIAAADGIVTGSTENALGGKVVFLRPGNKNYTLYYAHLDTQLVKQGQVVKTGDTLGLVGNTGNARTTAPHLHFGIYASGGAVDPLPFVDRNIKKPPAITASLANLGKTLRMDAKAGKLFSGPDKKPVDAVSIEGNALVRVEAATEDCYKVKLPDGRNGYVISASTDRLDKPLKRLQVSTAASLLDEPDTLAAQKKMLPAGEKLNVLANFSGYYFIRDANETEGWVPKNFLR